MPVTSLYAAVLAIIYIALTFYVVSLRVKFRVGIKSGGHKPLDIAIRIHGNFAEYIPLGLFLMALLETAKANTNGLHIFGQALVLGRLLHFWGLNFKGAGESIQRFTGSALTFFGILAAAIWLLVLIY